MPVSNLPDQFCYLLGYNGSKHVEVNNEDPEHMDLVGSDFDPEVPNFVFVMIINQAGGHLYKFLSPIGGAGNFIYSQAGMVPEVGVASNDPESHHNWMTFEEYFEPGDLIPFFIIKDENDLCLTLNDDVNGTSVTREAAEDPPPPKQKWRFRPVETGQRLIEIPPPGEG